MGRLRKQFPGPKDSPLGALAAHRRGRRLDRTNPRRRGLRGRRAAGLDRLFAGHPSLLQTQKRLRLTRMSLALTQPQPSGRDISIAAVLVLVLWLGCVAVGILGFVLPYARPTAPP